VACGDDGVDPDQTAYSFGPRSLALQQGLPVLRWNGVRKRRILSCSLSILFRSCC
jgi:hypothetical protein